MDSQKGIQLVERVAMMQDRAQLLEFNNFNGNNYGPGLTMDMKWKLLFQKGLDTLQRKKASKMGV